MSQAEVFNQHRPLLFSIAYRMLGSVMDAEDAVQEAFLRWEQSPQDGVRAPKSYLSTVVTRLCIDQLRSARTQREQYIGPWLPEPLITGEAADVDDKLSLADSISMAFLVLLERLAPVERAVFLLREVFGYEYAEIAAIVEKSEANCRQILRRARERIAQERPRFDASREQAEQITRRFLEASLNGDMQGLLELLADDAVLWSDGGGKVNAALNPVRGADKVARFFIGIVRKAPVSLAIRPAFINGAVGIIAYVDGRAQSAGALEIAGGKVRGVRIVVNPDKLRHLPAISAN